MSKYHCALTAWGYLRSIVTCVVPAEAIAEALCNTSFACCSTASSQPPLALMPYILLCPLLTCMTTTAREVLLRLHYRAGWQA
eukprot:14143-Heterococcus_DN1.PRE.2